jgi:hypothetical protein
MPIRELKIASFIHCRVMDSPLQYVKYMVCPNLVIIGGLFFLKVVFFKVLFLFSLPASKGTEVSHFLESSLLQ